MKLPSSLARVFNRFWQWLISPSLLFVTVMVSFPAFLFQKNLMVLVIAVLVFFLLALTRRGKLRLLPSILMIAGITFFALFSPHGQVLARWGRFSVTTGALEAGLTRGLTLAGMVFLSQLALSPQLHLPGKLGGFVVDMFGLLDKLTKEGLMVKKDKKFVGIKRLITSLDEHLYLVYWSEVQEGQALEQKQAPEIQLPERTITVQGLIAASLFSGILYFLLFV
jgi:hypothetical protein